MVWEEKSTGRDFVDFGYRHSQEGHESTILQSAGEHCLDQLRGMAWAKTRGSGRWAPRGSARLETTLQIQWVLKWNRLDSDSFRIQNS